MHGRKNIKFSVCLFVCLFNNSIMFCFDWYNIKNMYGKETLTQLNIGQNCNKTQLELCC